MEFDFDEDETNMRFKTDKPVKTANKLAEYADQNDQCLESEVNITDQFGVIRGTIAGAENRSYSKLENPDVPWNKEEINQEFMFNNGKAEMPATRNRGHTIDQYEVDTS